MKKTILILAGLAFFPFKNQAQPVTNGRQQNPVKLIESDFTIKNSSSEEFYFGLSEGDQISFGVNVANAPIKDVNFCEYPNTIIYSENNVSKIDNKTINISHTGIYYFQFHQSGFLAGKRSCFLKANRLAANEKTAGFNTTVYWESKTDTVWYYEDEKYLVSTDTLVTQIADQAIRLKKKGKTDRSTIVFTLPEKTDSWSIWICTGKDASANFANTEKQIAVIYPYVKKYGLMSALAFNGNISYVIPSGCLPVSYWFLTRHEDQQKFNNDSIRFIPEKKMTCLDYERRTDTLKGKNYMGVFNENRKNLDVFIKIASVHIVENWGTHNVRKFRIETKQIPYLKN